MTGWKRVASREPPIVSAGDLPELPIPKDLAVTRDFIETDGWVFPLSYVS
jgi:hypothetical protein